jgi:hypothetical protein
MYGENRKAGTRFEEVAIWRWNDEHCEAISVAATRPSRLIKRAYLPTVVDI